MNRTLIIIGTILVFVGLMVGVTQPLSITGNTLTISVEYEGKPISGSTVRVIPISDGAVGIYLEKTGPTGIAQIVGMSEGEYMITVLDETYGTASRKVKISSSLTSIDIDLSGPTVVPEDTFENAIIKGYVYSQLGNIKLGGATVTATGPTTVTTSSDSNGAYSLTITKAGIYKVQANHEGYQSSVATIDISSGVTVQDNLLIINGISSVTFYIKDIVTKEIIAEADINMGDYTGITNYQGSVIFENVLKDTYTVSTSAEGYLPDVRQIDISGDSEAFSIHLEPINPIQDPEISVGLVRGSAFVSGEENKPLAGALITFKHVLDSRKDFSVRTDANGEYEARILVGSYTISATADGFLSESYTAIQVFEGRVTRGPDIYLESEMPDYPEIEPSDEVVEDTTTNIMVMIIFVIAGAIMMAIGWRY